MAHISRSRTTRRPEAYQKAFRGAPVCQNKLPTGGGDHLPEPGVETRMGKKVFKSCVHPPAPIVPGVSGDINSLVSRIALITDFPVNREPILQRQDAEHGG